MVDYSKDLRAKVCEVCEKEARTSKDNKNSNLFSTLFNMYYHIE